MLTTPAEIPFHEVADAFPLMEGKDLEGLKDDILRHGLIEPIWTYQGKIIDGRNRYRACLDLSMEPDFREWDGNGSLAAFIASLNLHRRHLDASQRAMVGAKLKRHFEAEAKQRSGTRTDLVANLPPGSDFGKARDKAAETVKVSPRLVESASKVLRNGAPALIDVVEQGKVKVSAAAEVAELPEPEQEAVVAQGPAAVVARARKRRREKAERPARDDPEAWAETWTARIKRLVDEINVLLVSIPRRGGFANLTRRWSRGRVDGLRAWLESLRDAAEKGIAELETWDQ